MKIDKYAFVRSVFSNHSFSVKICVHVIVCVCVCVCVCVRERERERERVYNVLNVMVAATVTYWFCASYLNFTWLSIFTYKVEFVKVTDPSIFPE